MVSSLTTPLEKLILECVGLTKCYYQVKSEMIQSIRQDLILFNYYYV